MSDPITNAEIEDVLSSIRKLVTEETRKGDGAAPARVPESSDKLVLTPSLRVEVEEEPEADFAAWEAERQETPLVLADDTPVEPAVAAEEPELTIVASAPSEPADPPLVAEEQPEAPMVEEDAVAGETAEPVNDPTEDDVQVELAEDPAPEDPETDEVNPEIAEGEILDDDAPDSGLSGKIEALEAAIAETRDQWEPDPPLGDAYGGTVATLAWQDAEPERAPGDEAVLDEEMLRELVSEIVRAELQGALGERITRNVRKLVRREIQRALASQDLI